MKPSKTIKKKAYETIYSEEHDIPSDIFLPEEAFLAICDYLDEEYEKQQEAVEELKRNLKPM